MISHPRWIRAPIPRPTPSPGRSRPTLSKNLRLTNIANYRSFKSSLYQDLDLSGVVDSLQTNGQSTTVQERRIDSKQWSEELQLNYTAQFIDVVLGGFYFPRTAAGRSTMSACRRRNGMASNIPLLQAAGINLADAYALCGYEPGGVTGGQHDHSPQARVHALQPGHGRVSPRSARRISGWGLFSNALDDDHTEAGRPLQL